MDMDKIKELFALLVGARLIVEGNSRTFVKVPMWLVVLAALSSVKLAVVSALLAIAFGMRVRVVRA